MNNDKHSQQRGNDLQVLHSKMLKELPLFQLSERKWSELDQCAPLQQFQREYRLQRRWLNQYLTTGTKKSATKYKITHLTQIVPEFHEKC